MSRKKKSPWQFSKADKRVFDIATSELVEALQRFLARVEVEKLKGMTVEPADIFVLTMADGVAVALRSRRGKKTPIVAAFSEFDAKHRELVSLYRLGEMRDE